MLLLLQKIQRMRKAQITAKKFPNQLNEFKALKLETEVDNEVSKEVLKGLDNIFDSNTPGSYQRFLKWDEESE